MKKVFLMLPLMLGLSLNATADTDQVKRALEDRLKSTSAGDPGLHLETVSPTAIPGIYEVVTADHKILYSDSTGHYLITGHLIDTQDLRDITADRLDQVTAVAFSKLPFSLAIQEVRGNGARKLAIFSDTDCPFCRRLENDIHALTDVTIYTFLYPIASLHPNAYEHSRRIWCSENRLNAWRSYWVDNKVSDPGRCDVSALSEIQTLGHKLGVDATPTLIFESGRMVPGSISLADVEKLLNQR